MFVYLDDAMNTEKWPLARPPRAHETTRSAYVNLCLGTAQGTFFSLDKSVLTPVQKLGFLGLLVDTIRRTVAVPIEKFNNTCGRIFRFLRECETTRSLDVKTLQRLRVSVT